jgi:hypothetical protein
MDAFVISSLPSRLRRHYKQKGPLAPRTLLRYIATFRRKIDVLGIWPMPRRKANPVGKAGGVCKA